MNIRAIIFFLLFIAHWSPSIGAEASEFTSLERCKIAVKLKKLSLGMDYRKFNEWLGASKGVFFVEGKDKVRVVVQLVPLTDEKRQTQRLGKKVALKLDSRKYYPSETPDSEPPWIPAEREYHYLCVEFRRNADSSRMTLSELTFKFGYRSKLLPGGKLREVVGE